jgi:hypothetical protein
MRKVELAEHRDLAAKPSYTIHLLLYSLFADVHLHLNLMGVNLLAN